MRIIAGIQRGRKILSPDGEEVTRPIVDRVKKSVFDRLWSMGIFEDDANDPESPLPGGAAIDIFSGTGSMGLETLSRGFGHCTFIDRDRIARDRLEKNINTLEFSDTALIIPGDALSGAWINQIPYRPIRLFFCDPPYAMTEDPQTMAQVATLIKTLANIAESGAVMMLRTHESIQAPSIKPWTGPSRHLYGSMAIHFYILPAINPADHSE